MNEIARTTALMVPKQIQRIIDQLDGMSSVIIFEPSQIKRPLPAMKSMLAAKQFCESVANDKATLADKKRAVSMIRVAGNNRRAGDDDKLWRQMIMKAFDGIPRRVLIEATNQIISDHHFQCSIAEVMTAIRQADLWRFRVEKCDAVIKAIKEEGEMTGVSSKTR